MTRLHCFLLAFAVVCGLGCGGPEQGRARTPDRPERPPSRGEAAEAASEVDAELRKAEAEVPVARSVLRGARNATAKVLRTANELIRDSGKTGADDAPPAAEASGVSPAASRARAADVPSGASIAVLEFAARSGIAQEVGDSLGELVANTVRGLGDYKVLGKADLQALVGFEQVKDRLGCEETSCLAEIGGALGVDYLLGGNVSRLGGVFLINLRLVSAREVEVAGGVSRSVEGDESALVTAVPAAVEELFGVGEQRPDRKPPIWD